MAEVHHHHTPEPPRGNGGNGNAGVYAILVIIVILIVGAVLYFGGVLGPTAGDGDDLEADIQIEQPDAPALEVPDVDQPDVEIESPDIDVDLPDSVVIS